MIDISKRVHAHRVGQVPVAPPLLPLHPAVRGSVRLRKRAQDQGLEEVAQLPEPRVLQHVGVHEEREVLERLWVELVVFMFSR